MNGLNNGRSNTFIESACWPDDLRNNGTDFMFLWHYAVKKINKDGVEDINIVENSIYNSLNFTLLTLKNKS